MTIEIIGKFKPIDGVQTFRINGHKADLEKIIAECREMEADLAETPIMDQLRASQWTLILKIKLPVGVGKLDKST